MTKGNSLENYLIEHCAPTLAGIKSAGLFSYRFFSKEDVYGEIAKLNKTLNERGVYMEIMLWKEDYVLIYTYRRSHIEKDFRNDGVKELLLTYDYPADMEWEACLEYLKQRLAECDSLCIEKLLQTDFCYATLLLVRNN